MLVTTLEPCVMCAGAATQLAFDTVVFGPRDPVNGGVGRVVPPTAGPGQVPRFIGDCRTGESIALFRRWLDVHGSEGTTRTEFVRRLLGVRGG